MFPYEVKVSYENIAVWRHHIWLWGDGRPGKVITVKDMNHEAMMYANFVAGDCFWWHHQTVITLDLEYIDKPTDSHHVFMFKTHRAARAFQLRYGLDAK